MTYCHESAAAEPLAGTAPQRRVWLIIEQPGAWGQDALRESELPAGFGAELADTVTDPEIGIALARRPDLASHERRSTRRRRLWLAHTSPGGVRMRAGSLDDIRDVLRWDWAAIKRGELPPVGRRSADPALFICTNGKKDLSCALLAREIVDELRPDPELTGQVYESSHLTGHRFAPTALLLPWGYVYGRLDVPLTRELLSRAWSGQLLNSNLRGRTCLPAWAQAAEIGVRNAEGIESVDALDVVVLRNERTLPWTIASEIMAGDGIEVRHADGRSWQVSVEQVQLAPRMVSCGKDPEPGKSWQVSAVTAADRWHR